MPPSRRLSLSINPLWPHYGAIATIILAFAVGLLRYSVSAWQDPHHCNALMNEGSWLDNQFRNWQPEGCMMNTYSQNDATACLSSRRVIFFGDSVTRKLFFQFANIVDPKLPLGPAEDGEKHSDHSLPASSGTQLDFYWDPFLNSSQLIELLDRDVDPGTQRAPRTALLIFGTGLWYLRYANTSGGLPAWEARIEATLNSISRRRFRPADQVIILPIEDVVTSKLSPERASTMHHSDIDAMNSDLYHRVHPPAPSLFSSSEPIPGQLRPHPPPVFLPYVFNAMLDPSQTEDGLHYSDIVVKAQANLLLNFHCNDRLPKTFPLDKTCCRSYPIPSFTYSFILAAAFLWGPVTWLISRRGRSLLSTPYIQDEDIPPLVTSAAAMLIFAADRTDLWLKEQKQFSPWTFGFLSLTALAIGLVTVKRGDKDLGFLNRDQTDEWKGWMQLAILIYHYVGASKISGIYNPIRVLVAAYLFMTGYGHTTFYLKKGDFGFLRIAQILVRLNLLTILLAYTMNTDYISYYFAPLVSLWFLIIYSTMAVGSHLNERTPFLIAKIFISMGLFTWFMSQPYLLETLFDLLAHFCNIHWSAREWAFRVNLDIYIVYFGMLGAIAVIKAREYRITDRPRWALEVKLSIVASILVLVWYFAFELWQENKFVYNGWHPYVSFLPITAFVILRNANDVLRSASSRAFAFVGHCSLETFIIQYHFWLAGDTKGVLLVLPGTRWRPINFILTSIMFIYLSHRVAQATGVITQWICGSQPKTLPSVAPHNNAASGSTSNNQRAEERIPLATSVDSEAHKENEGDSAPPPHDTPVRPTRRWVDRLVDGDDAPSHSKSGWRDWFVGVKARMLIGLVMMWLVNITWT